MQHGEPMALNGKLSYGYVRDFLHLNLQLVMASVDQLESQKQLLLDEG